MTDAPGDNIRAVIEALRQKSSGYAAIAEQRALAALEREATRHTRQFAATVQASANINVALLLADNDLADLLSIRGTEFSALIRNLSDDVISRIERQVIGSVFEGRSNADIAKALREIDGISRNRARLIARDQTSKLNGAMNQFRQEQAGVTRYRWRTVIDGRERQTHHANNNKIFEWSRPPTATGHPGHDINCRCRALAVVIDDVEEAAGVIGPGSPEIDVDAQLPLIQRVAGLQGQSLFGRGRESLLVTQAEVRQAREAFDMLAKAPAIVEAEIDRAFEAVFGFPSKGQDLARMAGTTFGIGSRRSLLVRAIRNRLVAIEDLVERAAETASSVEAVRGAIIPPGAYARREVGSPPRPLKEAEAEAREFVLRQGRHTGHEWGYIHDQDGRKIGAVSHGMRERIVLSRQMWPELYSSQYRLVIHHNHPEPVSFSKADLRAFEGMTGLDTLIVHTADGSTLRVRVRDRRHIAALTDRFDDHAWIALRKAERGGKISAAAVGALYDHLRALVLHRLGWIEYHYELDGALKRHARDYRPLIGTLVKEIADAFD